MLELIQPILDFKNPVAFAIPIFLVLLLVELYLNQREKRELYKTPDALASISMGLGSVFIDIFTKAIALVAFTYLFNRFGFFSEYLSYTLLGWVLLFFFDDFTFYIHHRMSHQIRILWAAHVNHHSSQRYNLSTALRQSWAELFYKYIWYLWLPIIGFDPIMILTQISISLIYQFWIHTQLIGKMHPVFEYLFNTPSHHRVHHAKNIVYLDRNHAGILIIWDRMFGTFQEELEEEPVVYGITTNIDSYNPLVIASHEFGNIWKDLSRSRSLFDKLNYLFKPPGWSHDGRSKTADEMRDEQLL